MKTNTEKKQHATELRQAGASYPEIEKKLGVSRSTLSGWLSKLKLEQSATEKIQRRKKDVIIAAQALAAESHRNTTRRLRNEARTQMQRHLVNLQEAKPLILAALYIGEGTKRQSVVGFANSKPNILVLYVNLFVEIFQVPREKLICYLFLRFDQDAEEEAVFWSTRLGIPASNFRKPQFDKRTLGKKTWVDYHGVCAVNCFDAKIEKQLTALQDLLLETYTKGG